MEQWQGNPRERDGAATGEPRAVAAARETRERDVAAAGKRGRRREVKGE